MTQHTKILNLLENGNWICSSAFYALFIADPRTRLCELKKKGYQLESRKCQAHRYHEGNSKEWRLVGKTAQETTPQASQKPISDKVAVFSSKDWEKPIKEKLKTLF